MKTSSIVRTVAFAVSLLALSGFASRAEAQVYYAPYAMYNPVDTLSPSGAALGPWPWNFNIGGGPTPVVGDTKNELRNGANFTIGGGYNFTPRTGLVFEFMQSWLDVTDRALQEVGGDDGRASVWSFTINPVYRFRIGGPFGGYLIGGGGFYERNQHYERTVFVPTSHGGFDEFQVNNISDDAGGVNAGIGLTCNLGWGTKFYVEARYHYIFTPGYKTQIVPVTFGLRW